MRRVFKINEHQYRLLEKEVINHIFRYDKPVRLNESLGISDEVVRVAQDLYNKANERIDELMEKGKIVINCKLNSIEKVPFTVMLKNNADGQSVYRYKGQIINASVCAKIVNGKIDWKSFMDTAQHEINHLFEQDKVGDTYYDWAATTAEKYLYSNDLYYKTLATITYVADPFEQNAMVNGMYGYIQQSKKEGKLPVQASEIDAYQQLAKLYSARNFLLVHKDDIQFTVIFKENKDGKEFGSKWMLKKYKTRATDGIKSLTRKIKRTIEKCKTDGFSDNGIVVSDGDEWFAMLENDVAGYKFL